MVLELDCFGFWVCLDCLIVVVDFVFVLLGWCLGLLVYIVSLVFVWFVLFVYC